MQVNDMPLPSAQQILLDRAAELRIHAERLAGEAARLEVLAQSLPGIMPAPAIEAVAVLVGRAGESCPLN